MSELITLRIIFSEQHPARIQCLAEAASDPKHQHYGRHLRREELAALVALPEEERRSVVEWLAGFGMKVIAPPDGTRQWLFARATTEQIRAAFGEEIFCRVNRSADHRSARIASGLPRRLAGFVQQVSGLFDQREEGEDLISGSAALETAAAMVRETGRLRPVAGIGDDPAPPEDSGGFTPADIREIYQFPNEWDGSGETIALMLLGSRLREDDLQTFWRAHGISRSRGGIAEVGAAKTGQSDPLHALEAAMTVQWLGAMAPGAKIVIYHVDPALVSDPWAAFLLAAIGDTEHAPTVACTTWITPERRYYGAHGHGVITGLLNQCAALGITVISAAGDWGAFDGIPRTIRDGRYVSDAPWPHGVFPAVEERVLAVGGTMITSRRPLTEAAWSGPPPPGTQRAIHFDRIAGSGGFSENVPAPAWQEPALRSHYPRGAGRPAVVPYGRGFPDVALAAAGAGVERRAGEGLSSQGYQAVVSGQWIDYAGGTSIAAPVWAAIIARANQARRAAGLSRVGFVNPLLYQLRDAAPAPFRQITIGAADVAMTVVNRHGQAVTYDLPGYECKPGWNPATGLGVPNVTNLIAHLRQPR
ncbi:MAG TPA: S53 family peptidase [Blastocatellia bacterium]|nr:S53 family peptidase [Blastocatellia bacterium]